MVALNKNALFQFPIIPFNLQEGPVSIFLWAVMQPNQASQPHGREANRWTRANIFHSHRAG